MIEDISKQKDITLSLLQNEDTGHAKRIKGRRKGI